MKINNYYLIITFLLFITEVFIGFYMHDRIIRPYGGDLLVVILMYCFVKSFWDAPWLKTVIAVLIFAYAVEVSQYFNLLRFLGLQNSKVAAIFLGHSFSWGDMLCYTIGMALVVIAEKLRSAKPTPQTQSN